MTATMAEMCTTRVATTDLALIDGMLPETLLYALDGLLEHHTRIIHEVDHVPTIKIAQEATQESVEQPAQAHLAQPQAHDPLVIAAELQHAQQAIPALLAAGGAVILRRSRVLGVLGLGAVIGPGIVVAYVLRTERTYPGAGWPIRFEWLHGWTLLALPAEEP